MIMEIAATLCIDLNIKNNNGMTALDLAGQNGHTDVVNIFLEDFSWSNLAKAEELSGKIEVFYVPHEIKCILQFEMIWYNYNVILKILISY